MDKEVERLMRTTYARREENEYYQAVIKSLKFWQLEDYCRKSNKAQIFQKMYMNEDDKQGLLRVSAENHVTERTLYRYRREFVQMFKYFLEN